MVFGIETIEVGKEAGNSEELIAALSSALWKQGFVKETYIEAVLKREAVHPTGLPVPGNAIAIPHTDPEHVLKSRIAVATLKKPIQFSMMGSPEVQLPVTVVFMLAIKDPKQQPEVLRNLMKLFQQEELLADIAAAKQKQHVYELLTGYFSLTI